MRFGPFPGLPRGAAEPSLFHAAKIRWPALAGRDDAPLSHSGPNT